MNQIKALAFLALIIVFIGSLNAASRIQLRPSCDSVSVSFASGSTLSVSVINLPYKQEYRRTEAMDHPILGRIPEQIFYTRHDGGPKTGMLNGIALAKLDYSLDTTATLTSYQVCLSSAGSTYIADVARCLIEYPKSRDTPDDGYINRTRRNFCLDDALHNGADAVRQCKADRDEKVKRDIIATDADINWYIDQYGGCAGLDAEIEAWERYWGHIQ